jgi:DNA-binding PadR family transcriptional regulator
MSRQSEDASRFLPLTNLELHILLAVSSGVSHGYAIGKEVEARSHGRLRPTTGSLYQALRRLHAGGLLQEAPPPSAGEDARRQHFRLTPLGRRVAGLEARRLEELVLLARERRLLPEPS